MITKNHAEEIVARLTSAAPETLNLATVKQTALDLAAEVIRRASRAARIFKAEIVVPAPDGTRSRRVYLVAARSESRAENKVLDQLPPEQRAEIEAEGEDFDIEYQPPVTVTEVTNPYLASTGSEG